MMNGNFFISVLVFDGEGYLAATGIEFADALGEVVERLFGVHQAAGDDVGAHDDAAVGTIVDAVANLDLMADTRHSGIAGNEFQLLAGLARWLAQSIGNDEGYETTILFALVADNAVGAFGKCSGGMLGCVAELDSVDGKDAVDGFGFPGFACDSDIHNRIELTVNS